MNIEHNSNGYDGGENNVVHFPKKEKPEAPAPEPFINLPLVTKIMLCLIVAVHCAIWVADSFFIDGFEQSVILLFGFIPARLTGDAPFLIATLFTPLTYAFLHGGWLHVGVNTLMLGALGAGFEKAAGAKNTAIVFVGSVLCAALLHFILAYGSVNPMVGASGGISGLFGALLLVLYKRGQLGGGASFKKVLFVFIGISVVFGLLGGPDGAAVAWAAHIGGFLGGIGLASYGLKRKN